MARKFMRKFEDIDDGDSGKVNKPVWGSKRIRIKGKNSPERGQRGYHIAKKAFAKKVLRKEFWVYPIAKDKYGRTVVKIRKVRKDRKW